MTGHVPGQVRPEEAGPPGRLTPQRLAIFREVAESLLDDE